MCYHQIVSIIKKSSLHTARLSGKCCLHNVTVKISGTLRCRITSSASVVVVEVVDDNLVL